MRSIGRLVAWLAGGSDLRKNSLYTLLRQAAAALAELLTVVLIARVIGPEGNGQYAMVVLLPTLVATFSNLGVGPANVFYLGRGEATPRRATVASLKIAAMIAPIVLVISAPVVWAYGSRIFPGVPRGLLLVGLAAYPFILGNQYLRTVLQGIEDFRRYNWAVLAAPLVTLACVGIALGLLDSGTAGAAVAFTLGRTIGFLIVAAFVVPYLVAESEEETRRPQRSYLGQALHYGGKAHLSNLIAFLHYRADLYLVNLLLNPAATGIYVIAVQIAERLWMPAQAASTVLLPRLSGMYEDPTARLRLALRGFAIVAAVTAVSGLLALGVAYWLLGPVLGQEYERVLVPLAWLLPGIVAAAGAKVQGNFIAAIGRPEWNTYVSCVLVSVNVAGNLVLIPAFGLAGAAAATSVTYLCNAMIKTILVRKSADQ